MTAVAIAAAMAIAACGSNSPATYGSGDQPTQAQIQQEQQSLVRFADCMRTHGVASFPDPTSAPHEFKGALNAQSPAFHSAEAVCGHLLPPGGQHGQTATRSRAQIAAMLAFARCLRRHGFPTFPDPTSSGEVTREMLANAGIDLHQPAVQPAADACVGVTHGVITEAAVARYIAGR